MHVLHRSSLIYLWWNNYVIIRPFCHIIVVCFLWTWHSGSKLGWYRPDAGSHRADASVFLTHNVVHIQSGEGAYRRGNSLDDSRLWSAAVEPDGRACAEWTINPTVPVCIVDQTGVQCYWPGWLPLCQDCGLWCVTHDGIITWDGVPYTTRVEYIWPKLSC